MDYYKRVINVNDIITLNGVVDSLITGSTETLPLTISVMFTQKIEDIGVYDDIDDDKKQ